MCVCVCVCVCVVVSVFCLRVCALCMHAARVVSRVRTRCGCRHAVRWTKIKHTCYRQHSSPGGDVLVECPRELLFFFQIFNPGFYRLTRMPTRAAQTYRHMPFTVSLMVRIIIDETHSECAERRVLVCASIYHVCTRCVTRTFVMRPSLQSCSSRRCPR